MINWQDKAYRTLQEHVLRNTQDIRELFKKLRHTRWTTENVAKLYDSLTALKYDDPEIALDLIDELITALGGNPPARPKHALIGIKAETSHGAVDQYDLIDKDWFEVTAYFEDGTSEPVTDFLLLTEVAMTAPYTNVEVEYLGFRDVVPLEANARRVITLNTANTTTVVNDQTGRVLHNGDSVFDGDVLTMASSQPNGGYLITGRNVEQLGIVNPIEVGGSVVVHADVIVNVFAKAEVYHTVTINKASGVTFTLVDEAGNNVASGASFLEGTKLTVTAIGDVYPHAAVVGGELIQLYEGTVIVVSDDVVITVGEAQPEPEWVATKITSLEDFENADNVIMRTDNTAYAFANLDPDARSVLELKRYEDPVAAFLAGAQKWKLGDDWYGEGPSLAFDGGDFEDCEPYPNSIPGPSETGYMAIVFVSTHGFLKTNNLGDWFYCNEYYGNPGFFFNTNDPMFDKWATTWSSGTQKWARGNGLGDSTSWYMITIEYKAITDSWIIHYQNDQGGDEEYPLWRGSEDGLEFADVPDGMDPNDGQLYAMYLMDGVTDYQYGGYVGTYITGGAYGDGPKLTFWNIHKE